MGVFELGERDRLASLFGALVSAGDAEQATITASVNSARTITLLRRLDRTGAPSRRPSR